MADFHVTASIRKASEADGAATMYGWASVVREANGVPVVDSDGDFIPIGELEKAAQQAFLERGGRGSVGMMHEDFAAADLVESFVLSREKTAAFGLGAAPEGWMVGLRSRDPDVVRSVRSGATLELSIRGRGRRVPTTVTDVIFKRDSGTPRQINVIHDLELSDVELLSIVDKGAAGNENIRPRIVLIKRGKHMTTKTDVTKRTAPVILAELFEAGKLTELPPEDKEALLMVVNQTPPATPAPAEPVPAPVPAPEPEPKPEDIMSQENPEDKPKPAGDTAKRDAEIAKLATDNVELVKRIGELEAERERDKIAEVVKRDMAFLPGASIDELAKIVQASRQNLGEAEAKSLETVMRSASEGLRKSGLFEAIGVRTEGNGDETLIDLAKAMKKDAPQLSMSEALLAAGRQRPDLWKKAKSS